MARIGANMKNINENNIQDEMLAAIKMLLATARQSSWAHIVNPKYTKCQCKGCAIEAAKRVIQKAERAK